jgi:23S rRNA (adenine2503-C2)-methyltransferase
MAAALSDRVFHGTIMTEKQNIRDMSLAEIEAFIANLGKEKYRARQIMKWLYMQGVTSFGEMTTLAREFRARMEEMFIISEPALDLIQTSADGTKKILFRLTDGLAIESVLIPRDSSATCSPRRSSVR